MIDLRSQCWVFQHDCQWCVGENMHQVLLEVEGPGKSPKVRNEQLIQYCKIPILGMVHKTWKKYCTASSLLLYLGVGDVCFFLTMRCFNDAMFSNS